MSKIVVGKHTVSSTKEGAVRIVAQVFETNPDIALQQYNHDLKSGLIVDSVDTIDGHAMGFISGAILAVEQVLAGNLNIQMLKIDKEVDDASI